MLDERKKRFKQISVEFMAKNGKSLGMGNLHTRLALLEKKKIAKIEKEGVKVFYSITPEGIAIKKQLHA